MAETPSTMLPLGTLAPDFALIEPASGQIRTLQSLKGEVGTMIMFICNHCPYVKHLLPRLVEVVNTYVAQGISSIAINANDVANYPDDAPEKMAELVNSLGNPFAYLYDESQAIARAYQAACTPDFYLFNKDLRCVYRGRFDAATPKNQQPVTGAELSAAMAHLCSGTPIPVEPQIPSLGCNIKWKQV